MKRMELTSTLFGEKVRLGHVRVLHIPSSAQYNDIFTKGTLSIGETCLERVETSPRGFENLCVPCTQGEFVAPHEIRSSHVICLDLITSVSFCIMYKFYL
ncbi:hypothetical protein HanXRQr2_Chr10g0462101 [Helianthus annuus]|uniref:Uncharacterized protein n=1 Tax=Helianthus annuus TaxID=4232 RepID=A0A9K3I1H0_HELAN|nr:hypothetical protein HanXRQr2_Chr10g0462101 [Helianthus annuus]